jgi:hypothetical protein
MGKHPRIGLLLGAAACLLAVLFDWIGTELSDRKSAPARALPVSSSSPPAEPATATPYTA